MFKQPNRAFSCIQGVSQALNEPSLHELGSHGEYTSLVGGKYMRPTGGHGVGIH